MKGAYVEAGLGVLEENPQYRQAPPLVQAERGLKMCFANSDRLFEVAYYP